ncbi:hypothetical protein [Vallitalea okinawensis]|uniref:hypothetical protein n=1 Tax=Vallitalea okinawensis TaxID=2078660 RepID=UPI000CFC821E|nr:hypothetical protein [Vallitalea okinawensis]
MYDEFCMNFKQYLRHHSSNLCKNKELLEILGPFYGLSNFDTYENWKLRSDIRYYETSNLVHHLSTNIDQYPAFEMFYQELCDQGYDAHKSEEFLSDIIVDQLKLINLLLGPATAEHQKIGS